MGKFWTLGSYVGKKRDLVDLKGLRSQYETMLEHKIRDWKNAPERIAELDIKIAKLEEKIRREDN